MTDVLRELNDAIDRGSERARLRALRHATDVLIAGQYSEDEIWTLGEVIERLASEIEAGARSRLAAQLAGAPNAPSNVVSALALDDAVEVAGPVLQHSDRIDVRTLVTCARTKGQQHLLAISKRRSLSQPVTDVLVERGDREVVRTVAANPGARFSDAGFLQLVTRAQDDRVLADCLGARKDVPRHIFQQLIAKAFDEAKARIAGVLPGNESSLHGVVADVTGELHAKFGPSSPAFYSAKRIVGGRHRRGELGEQAIHEYALAHKLDETIAGLSCLSGLPVDIVERALMGRSRDMILLIARSQEFSWETTMALLFAGAQGHRLSAAAFDGLKDEYARLSIETAREIVESYRSRRSGQVTEKPLGRLPPKYRV